MSSRRKQRRVSGRDSKASAMEYEVEDSDDLDLGAGKGEAEPGVEDDDERRVSITVPEVAPRPEPRSMEGRLVIPRIVVNNFKSYAGVKEIGPFHKNFTAVVGPNGSGKSNVIDSLLFVFGKKANKMRFKKISEVIHKSSNYPNLQKASVAVHFANIREGPDAHPDHPEVIPGSELVVSRSVTKTGTSTYKINGKKATWAAVSRLLMEEKGIDLEHNRFLILQGEVEEIALKKPIGQSEGEEGLLEFIEEIIGSNRYAEPLAKAEAAVDQRKAVVAERNNRVRAEKQHLSSLKAERDEAHAHWTQQEKVIVKSHLVCQIRVAELRSRVTSLAEDIAALQEEYSDTEKRSKEAAAALKALDKQASKCSRDHDKLQRVRLNAKDALAEWERTNVRQHEELKHLRAKESKLAAAVRKAEAAIVDKEAQVVDAEQSMPHLEAVVQQVTHDLAAAETALDDMRDSLRDETAALHVKLEAAQSDLLPWSQRIADAKAEVDVLQAEADLLQQNASEGRQRYEEAKQRCKHLSTEVRQRTTAIAEATAQLSQAEERIGPAKAELVDAETAEVRARAQLQRAEDAAAECIAAASQQSSQNSLLRNLMKAQSKGHLAGVYGRLGDLGAIDAKYDVAISTACPALHHIVVDTTKHAQKCVDALRMKNWGRATFIIMEKVAHYQSKMGPIQPPKGAVRLFDLVRVRDENRHLLPAFYHALRNTLVVNTLDDTRSYPARKWRVVTLKGELVDSTGTLSGGGKTVMRGSMPCKLSSGPVNLQAGSAKDAEARVAAARQAAQVAQERAQALRDEVKQCQASLRHWRTQLPKMQLDVESFSAEKSQLKAQIPLLREQASMSSEDKERLAAITSELQGKQAKLAKETKGASKIEVAIARLRKQLDAVGGAELQAARDRVIECSQAVEAAEADAAKARAAGKAARKAIPKLRRQLTKLASDLDAVRSSMASLAGEDGQDDTVAEEGAQLRQALEDAEASLQEAADALRRVKADQVEAQDSVAALRRSAMDAQHRLEDMTSTSASFEAKLTKANDSLAALEVRMHQVWKILHPFDDQAGSNAQELEDGEAGDASPDHDAEHRDTGCRLRHYSAEELTAFSKDALNREVAHLKKDLEGKQVFNGAIREYEEKLQELSQHQAELDEATEKLESAMATFESLRKRHLDEFTEGFTVINRKLKQIYQMITFGGDAELERVDAVDPFADGIRFTVMPPKKSWKPITNLSGGEKTLASLALVFALHHYKPTPLYVMDEIDAALDFRNVSIIGNYIKERTRDAQFIVISLRNNMFELADRLVGIYKTDDNTKSVTINPHAFRVTGQASATKQRDTDGTEASQGSALRDVTNATTTQ